MKIIKIVSLALATIALSACSTPKYKTFSTPANVKTAGNMIMGKTPKEAAAIIGKPMSAYFKDGDKGTYLMIYPRGDAEVSMTDLMFNDRLECFSLNFEKEKGYKYDGWWSNESFTCGAIKGQQLDMSLIEN